MKNKIIVNIGISGSGKSTFSSLYVKENPRTIIVSRDEFRKSMFGYCDETYNEYYKLHKEQIENNEAVVSDFCNNQIEHALRNGYDVICDNTHLQKKYVNEYKQFGVPIELKFYDIDKTEAIRRDSNRTKSIGIEVISKQYISYSIIDQEQWLKDIEDFNNELYSICCNCKKIEYDFDKRDAIIFDIDGTLAIKGNRSPYDWKKVYNDKPNFNVLFSYKQLRNLYECDLFICSGRDEICRDLTEHWLSLYEIDDYEKLYMRPLNNCDKDWKIKSEFWREIQKTHNIIYMVDDRNQVVDFARRLGYDVHQVNYGNF